MINEKKFSRYMPLWLVYLFAALWLRFTLLILKSLTHICPLAVTTKVIPDLMVRGRDPLPLLSGRVIKIVVVVVFFFN